MKKLLLRIRKIYCKLHKITSCPFQSQGRFKKSFCCGFNNVTVVVQFYPWFKFYFFCFKLINIHYHNLKQKKLKPQPRIKLTDPQHNLYDEENINFSIQRYKFWSLKASLSNSWICDYNVKCFHRQVQVTSSAHYKFTHSFFWCGSILSLV